MTALRNLDWFKAMAVVNGVATVVVAALAVLIQRQLAKTNRLQLRLALFKRRMKVFDSTMNFVAAIGREAKVDLNQLFDLIRETREHDLLFGPEVGEYITALYKSGNELRARALVGGQEDIERRTELLHWFGEQTRQGTKIFLKYLDFREP